MDLGEDLSSLFGKRSKTSSSSTSTVNRTRSRGTEEAPTSFNQKKCIAWFRQYSSTSSPDTMGNYFDNSYLTWINSQLSLFFWRAWRCWNLLSGPGCWARECCIASLVMENGSQTNGIFHIARMAAWPYRFTVSAFVNINKTQNVLQSIFCFISGVIH